MCDEVDECSATDALVKLKFDVDVECVAVLVGKEDLNDDSIILIPGSNATHPLSMCDEVDECSATVALVKLKVDIDVECVAVLVGTEDRSTVAGSRKVSSRGGRVTDASERRRSTSHTILYRVESDGVGMTPPIRW